MNNVQLEYKYVLVSHCSGPNTVRVLDLSNPGFGRLFEQGWVPVREMRLGGGGEAAGTSIMVLLSRVKVRNVEEDGADTQGS